MKEFHYAELERERERAKSFWNSDRVNGVHIKAYQICIFRVAICATSNFSLFALFLILCFSISLCRFLSIPLSEIDSTNDKITAHSIEKMYDRREKKKMLHHKHSYRKYVYFKYKKLLQLM